MTIKSASGRGSSLTDADRKKGGQMSHKKPGKSGSSSSKSQKNS